MSGDTHPSELRFALGSCSLGLVLVATTDDRIAAILLGDHRNDLVEDLKSRFPDADLVAADHRAEEICKEVSEWIEHPSQTCNFALHLSGTAFQRRVWRALLEIPAGTTATYREIAEKIGAPRATRAVASACAANKIAIAVPCHRVVRHDRSISGYRWGTERKRLLLEREALATRGHPLHRIARTYA